MHMVWTYFLTSLRQVTDGPAVEETVSVRPR